MDPNASNINAKARAADENRSASTAFDGRSPVSGTVVAQPTPPSIWRLIPWSWPLLFVGIALVAACVLVPAREENRQLALDMKNVQGELDAVNRQVEVNAEFLRRVATDPDLAERLSMKQIQQPMPGRKVLDPDLPRVDREFDASPFTITQLPATQPLVAAPPAAPLMLLADPRSRIITLCVGIFIIAVGVVIGASPVRKV